MKKLRAGILGATGAVGQQFIRLLRGHPWFEIAALSASERSAGRAYGDVVRWIDGDGAPGDISAMIVDEAANVLDVDVAFSGLDASVAGDVESAYAAAGIPVLSNAKNHRMRFDVPLLIPDVNPDHVGLIDRQGSGSGFIVTNPNCATVGLVCALKPLVDAFGVSEVHVTTMQAVSGAGYPGVASLDILGNVIPFIAGEESKVESEPLKILGRLGDAGVEPLRAVISAQCNRVPVIDGHMLSVSVRTVHQATPGEAAQVLRAYRSPLDGLGLPSAPQHVLHVHSDSASPQPRRHVWAGNGMTVSVGRIRACPVLGIRFVALVHNTVRGAAGGAILNAELLVSQGRIGPR